MNNTQNINWREIAATFSSYLKKFQEYVAIEIVDAIPKSPLGKALAYAQKLLPSMRIFLTNGCLEIENNAAERTIKPFVIGRKHCR